MVTLLTDDPAIVKAFGFAGCRLKLNVEVSTSGDGFAPAGSRGAMRRGPRSPGARADGAAFRRPPARQRHVRAGQAADGAAPGRREAVIQRIEGDNAMQFLILNYVKPRGFMETMPKNDPDGPAWGAYTQALVEAGVMRGGARAQAVADRDHTADRRGPSASLHDGPYADTKEQLGGFFLIEVPDLEAALAWAARNPAAASGAVEVRPLVEH